MAIARAREYGTLDQTLVYSSGKQDPPKSHIKYTSNTVLDLASIPSSAIERIVSNYADTHLPQYPCISRSMLDNIVQRAKHQELPETDLSLGPEGPSELDHFEYFVLYIVLAISTMTLTWKADGQARRSSESFYNSALMHLQQLEECGEIKALRISLLLVHYAQMCPERLDNWTCIANAVRIVLNMGMYMKSPESMPADQARERSELFWVTYGMERSLCTNLRLPLSFPEEIIMVDFDQTSTPSSDPDEIVRKSSANQIRKYRILETEVHRVLHLEEDLNRFGHTTIDEWMQDISGRLSKWYEEAQFFTKHNMLEFKHIQFHHLLARIHRPTPRLKSRTPADRQIVLESCRILIEDYFGQERRRRLFYPWHGVHILFETALISLDACWLSHSLPLSRDQAIRMLDVYLPQCLQVISNIGERWSEATACADRLRPLVDKVRSALVQENAIPLLDDASIADEINDLLFSDKPLMPRNENPGLGLFSLDDGSIEGTFPLVDDAEFFQWDPDWSIMPPESMSEDVAVNDSLHSSSEGLAISSLLSLSSAL